MDLSVYDLVGTIGVAIIIVTYVLLQLEKLKSTDLYYSALNAIGASMIIFSLYFDFNLAAFVIEFFWLLISLFGITKYLRDKR